ncbi:MAG: cell wall-binding repeat-containing protein [Clostridium sp.]|jgi:putative cell wall-binding protein|uniref:cell wall-binding repeat-containing protein n=1 Tax=Clostridium sp. TaxID=1506 RepID=UPI0025B8CC38|nr:cell wall-binding repeat-containing protein [Clostridium sp.]MCH3965056.1 cell wall-binding repeat-containing protein [Clostridium sp.]MCI1714277.1 cell wall-binding repeat-containing protein [Clostridium sp.]MCI1798539.1 cell wall-binding repeat-containing protein [Clostridium sp.]MCI1812730.1 cell wall-binding repeat-containing protein [Clostridium sp.]MCI1869348.1 cell wall-binding repeat-containing protein [Clostridium sp.]
MSKKSTKVLASATLMSLVLTTALTTGPAKAAAGSVTRAGGADRYATAAQVATENWAEGSENVVLVSGQGYADSVSASVLAKKLNAPILLTTPDELSADASSALTKLSPKNVYIVGGTASISDAIESGLKGTYSNVERLGGKDRYDTNLAVAQKLVDLGVSKDNIIAVAGTGFSDALSVAPVAAAKDEILLLTNNNVASLSATTDFAKDANVTVVGTTNVVSDAVYDALKADSRVDGGTDRFETNLNVLNKFDSDLKTDKLYAANASGQGYADALVASAVAGKYSAPLVLLDTEDAAATSNAVKYIGTKATKTTDLQVVGGTGVVTDSTVSAINNAVNPSNNNGGDAEVSSIDTVGLNQIKIVFNQEVDEDTAKEVANYKVDGDALTDGDAVATLQDDDKTVLITLADAQKQNDDVDVTVKKAILTSDKSETVPEFTQTVTFSDTTAPTVDSVSVRGNNKLDIVFSEAVKADGSDEEAALKSVVSKLKINGKNLSSFGINYDYSELDDGIKATGEDYYYTDEVELYFDSKLPTGDNTLKVSDGDDNALEDAAGFPVEETTEDFSVDDLSSAPEIKSIEAKDDGTVKVNFDRPMDAKTAVKSGYYKINGKTIPSDAVALKEDDTQVKITKVSGLLNKNSNTISISDDVKDAYGNHVEDDTNESFTLEEDTTKPTVTSIYALDDDTIRVKFSKDVDALYATNKSNYKLKDNDGTDITGEIDNITVPGDDKIEDGDTTDIVDINVGEDLTDSQYTLTVKNIQDTAKTPNVMDDYTDTFDGAEDVKAKADAYKVDADTIVIVFNKAMDSSTLDDTDSYEYVNEKGDTKTLPSSADVTVNDDNKSVTIDLSDTSLATDDGDKSDENTIKSIYATGIKDEDGNSLSTGNNGGTLVAYDGGTTVKPTSLSVKYDGDDLKADVSFTQPIDEDTADKTDFTLNGQTPSTIGVDGSKVTLTFDSDDDDDSRTDTLINKVKAGGIEAKLNIVGEVNDILGKPVTASDVQVYSYDAAPKLIINKDGNDVQNWTATSTSNEADIKVEFDTPIEISSVKPSDFTFNVGGTTVDASSASADGNTVTFKFTGSDFNDLKAEATDNKVKIAVKPVTSTKISTKKDLSGDYAYYVPTSDDTETNYVTLTLQDGGGDTGVAHTTAVKPSLDVGKKTMIIVTLTNTSDDGKYDIYYGDQKLTKLDTGVYSIDIAEDVTKDEADTNITFKSLS